MIRPLGVPDAEAYSALRLRALVEHPEAFGASPETHPDLATVRSRLAGDWAAPDDVLLGAFEGEALVGLCHVRRLGARKVAHRGDLTQMYVAPEARGRGHGRALLEEAIARARSWGLARLGLAVVADNREAAALYAALGFEVWGVEPAALRVGDRDHDEVWMSLAL